MNIAESCAGSYMDLATIQLVALDVDGVLTDGTLYLDEYGREINRFHVRDGMGIRLLLEAGILVGWITARNSDAVKKRAEDLGISFLHQDIQNKRACFDRELKRIGNISASTCAYMGDDVIDLEILNSVGWATAPQDAHPEVLSHVHWVAPERGGHGAVRALAETILQARRKRAAP